MKRTEPWYYHVPLWIIIAVLAYLLIQVAIVEPQEIMKMERYYKAESRARMSNLRQAEILWEKKFGRYTDNLDSLIKYVSTDSAVIKMMTEIDTITKRSKNPFEPLVSGDLVFDSLYFSPKSHSYYILKVDTSQSIDTVINRYGKLVSIDTTITIGTRYLLECPDGYGKIGDLYSDALKNTASWE